MCVNLSNSVVSVYLVTSTVLYFILFFHDSSTTEIYTYCHTLSLHDSLPIYSGYLTRRLVDVAQDVVITMDNFGTENGVIMQPIVEGGEDRKSTRLNSSH